MTSPATATNPFRLLPAFDKMDIQLVCPVAPTYPLPYRRALSLLTKSPPHRLNGATRFTALAVPKFSDRINA